MNLKTIQDMAATFKTVVGLSDHSLDGSVPVAAVALGAKIIEKHFILDRKLGGPDAAFSLEPGEFHAMVKAVKETEIALGEVNYELTDTVRKNRDFARSLFLVRDIKAGETFTEENVRSIRPGHGMPPKHLKEIIGKTAVCDIKKGTPMSWKFVG
jgi:pseudaminic acid synthase